MEYINTHVITQTPHTNPCLTTENHQMVGKTPEPLVDPGTCDLIMMTSDDSNQKKTFVDSQLQTMGSVALTDSQYFSESASPLKSGQNPVTDTLCEMLDWDPTECLKSLEVELSIRPQQHAFVIGNTTNVTCSDHPNQVVTHRGAQVVNDLGDAGQDFEDFMNFVQDDSLNGGNVFAEVLDNPEDTEMLQTTTPGYQQNPTEDSKGAFLLGSQLISQGLQRCESVDLHASQVPVDSSVQEQCVIQQTSNMYSDGNHLITLDAEAPVVQSTVCKDVPSSAFCSSQEANLPTAPIHSTSQYSNSRTTRIDHMYVQQSPASDPGMASDSDQTHSAVGDLYSEGIDDNLLGCLVDLFQGTGDISSVVPTTSPLTTVNLAAFNALKNNTASHNEETSTRSVAESYLAESVSEEMSCPASSPDIPSSVQALAESEDEDTALDFGSGPGKSGSAASPYNGRVASPCKEKSILQFLKSCLHDPTRRHLIKWVSERDGHFEISKKNKDELAMLWFHRKDSSGSKAKYGHFTRAMRYYYKKNMLRRIDGKKLQYQFLTS